MTNANSAGLSLTANETINTPGLFTVTGGALMTMGTTTMGGSGAFTLASGGTLAIGQATGINGNITVSGTKTLSPGANYIYNGTAAQAAGALLPATVNSLTDNNTTGAVTLGQVTTVTAGVTLAGGAKLGLPSGTSSAATLSIGGVNKAAGTWGNTGTGATYIDSTHFAGTGVLNVGSGPSSSTALASSLNPSTYGSSVTFTATVTGSGPTPTGTVTFKDGSTTLGTGTLDGSGATTFATSALTATGSPHSITAVYGGDSDYGASTSSALTQTVNPLPITVTADAKSKIYGDSDPALTSQVTSGSLVGSDTLTGSLTRVAGETMGAYAIQQGTLTAGGNYALTYVGANLTINAKPITVTADAKSKTYGDSDPALTSQVTSGSLVGSDSLSGSLTRVSGENAGSYAIQQGTLTAGGNYTLTYVGANLTIGQKPLLAQADNQSRAYTQTNPVFTITYTGFVGSDTVSNLAVLPEASTLADTNSPIGTYDITLSGGSDTNYSLVLSNGTLTVTAAAITVTADAQSKTYGDSDPALTYQITTGALLPGDSLNGSLTRVAGENVGAYAIQQGTLAASTNYTLSYVGANLTINAKPITVTADAQSKTYGDSDPALTSQITSGALVGSDTLTGSLTRVAGENVGTYAIQQGTLAASTNYTLTYVGANLTINAKPITVTADAQSKTYGDSDPALTSQVTSGFLVGSDTLTGSLTRVAGETVGAYAIQQGTLTAGGNYALTYVGANLTINAKPITVTADAKSKTYGDSDPALTSQITSGTLVGSDALTGSLTRVAGENVGSYAIQQGSLTAGGNYTLTYVGANLAIGQKALLAQADNQSRAYAQTNPVFTITYTGFVGSDTVSNLAVLPEASTLADTNSPIGTYDITLSGGSDTNYSLVLSNGTLTVTAAAITVTADAQSKTYGDSDPALTYQITTGALLPGDSLNGSLTRVAGESVGTYTIQQGTLAASTNYTLTYVSANLTINAKPITVTADAQSKTYGDSDPALTSQVTSGFLVGSDTLTGSLTRVAGETVGAYAIQQGRWRPAPTTR